VLDRLIQQLIANKSLTAEQAHQAVGLLVDETVPPADKAEFLAALARKGETPEEIAAFARALRAHAVTPPLDAAWRQGRVILDVVGTGGDRLSTFNISTAAALVAAAAGVPVAKHGNRAVTSAVGSADVMEALGLPFDVAPEAAAQLLQAHGFAFFFAPRYHPAFRHIAPARRLCAERGQRTIFNFLGPLLNPAQPTAALVGVPRPELCAPLAQVLQSLGLRRAMVVCGDVPPESNNGARHGGSPAQAGGSEPTAQGQWLDELSTLGPSTVAEFHHEGAVVCSTFDPTPLPMQPARLADLRGGDAATNAQLLRGVLRGQDRGPRRDAVLLNAGAALFVAGVTRSIAEGWELAERVIDDGRAGQKLEELRQLARRAAGGA